MQKPSRNYKESIKEWPKSDRPREKLEKHGPAYLSDSELLAILIGSGSGKKNALDLARDMLKQFGGFQDVDSASVEELCKIKGIGRSKAVSIKAGLEIGRRFSVGKSGASDTIKTSEDIVNIYLPKMKNMKKEVFKVALLNAKNRVMKVLTVSEGGFTSSVVQPKEVFNPAIREAATSVILMHNHPSGDPSPSEKDKHFTKRIAAAGELIDIKVLDHIIIGDNRYYSFSDEDEI